MKPQIDVADALTQDNFNKKPVKYLEITINQRHKITVTVNRF